MALWNWGETSNGVNLKLIAVQGSKVKGKEDAPKFGVQEKAENGKYETVDTYTQLSGVVKSISSTETGEGHDRVRGFKLILQDGDETYYIDSTMTNASKDLANHALASIGKFIKISLYLNKNNYPSASVKLQDDSYAPTEFNFKDLDKDTLWEAIKAQEGAKQEEEEVKWAEKQEETVDFEDLPF